MLHAKSMYNINKITKLTKVMDEWDKLNYYLRIGTPFGGSWL